MNKVCLIDKLFEIIEVRLIVFLDLRLKHYPYPFTVSLVTQVPAYLSIVATVRILGGEKHHVQS